MKRHKKQSKKSQKMMSADVEKICAMRNVSLIRRELADFAGTEREAGLQVQLDKWEAILAKYTEA